MKQTILGLLAFSLACSLPSRVPNGVGSSAVRGSSAEQEVISLSRQKWRWMAERNVDSLAALFNEGAVFVHVNPFEVTEVYVRRRGAWTSAAWGSFGSGPICRACASPCRNCPSYQSPYGCGFREPQL